MKKYCALLLALLLLCAAAPLALAMELYDNYGYIGDWDDATWELSEGWSDEQWQEYWQGQEAAYARERAEELQAERLALGLPNPDGANVKLNESFLTFTKAWPYEEDGSVYLPLRDFLAACGIEAQISYDAATGIAHTVLADGRELTTMLGSDEILTADADGEEYPIYTYDNAARMIDGSFYVLEWVLCDFVGLDSRWDYDMEILYIVDKEALIELLDSEFTSYNRIFSLTAPQLDAQQAYRLSGSLAFNGVLYGDTQNDAAQAVLEYDALVQGANVDTSFALKLDVDQIKDTLLSFMDTEDKLLLKALSAGKGRLIINGAEQTAYLQSNLLPLADAKLKNSDWLKLEPQLSMENLAEFGNMLQGQFAATSIGSLIYDNSYRSYYYSGGYDVYANALTQAKLWQALIGDENFKQESLGGYTVYTLQTDQAKLKKAIEGSDVSWPGGDIFGSLFGYYSYYYFDEGDAHSLSHTLTFREKDGQILDLQAGAEVKTGGYLPVSYSINLEYGEGNLQARFEMAGRYGGKFSLEAQQKLIPAKDTPAAAPPSNSHIALERELESRGLFW